jgi:hypothetical protein
MNARNMSTTILSFASKQIWPQVLSVLHTRPKRLILFHTAESTESSQPAQRLKEFFEQGGIDSSVVVELQLVPHDDFSKIIDVFASIAERLELDDSNCMVNLTGGNKLMALAAAEWCRLAGVPCFYLERDNRVFKFHAQGVDLLPQPDFKLDIHLARELDPLNLLRCQLGDSEVTDPGQRLKLNEPGRKLPENEIGPLLNRDVDFRKFLDWDMPSQKENPGDALEYATAVTLLKLGVPVVQRSVRLVPKLLRGSGREEGELDLIFNWTGRLWVVDCKNRIAADDRIDKLRREILSQTSISPRIAELLQRLTEELRERELHPLKQDLLNIAEVGGLLGQAICIRLNPLPPQANDFAQSRRIPIILRPSLVRDLKSTLFPNQSAAMDQLRALAVARTRAVS